MDIVKFILGILILSAFFMYGRWTGHMDYHEKLIQAQREVQTCENLWKLDVDFFYPELCKRVCAEEFENMGC